MRCSPYHCLGTSCCTHSSISVSVLVLRSPNRMQHFWCNLVSVTQKQRNISADLLAILMPDKQGFFTTLVHYSLVVTLSSLRTPRFFSAERHTSWPVFSLPCSMGLFSPRRISHLSVLNFMKSLPSHFSILLTALWMALTCQYISVVHWFGITCKEDSIY